MEYDIDTQEAARILGVSGRRVRQLAVDDKRFSFQKIGKGKRAIYLFNREEVERFAQTPRSTGRPPKSD